MSLLNKKMSVEFDVAMVIRTTVLVVAILLIINVISDLASTIGLVITAAFLAVAVNPVVSRIAGMLPSKSRTKATGASFVLVMLFLIGFFTITIPPIASQVSDFATDLPATVEEFKNQDNFLANAVERYELDADISQAARDIASRVGSGDGVLNTVSALTSTVYRVVAVLIMTFMMLVEGPGLIKRFWALTDRKKLAKRKQLASQINEVITDYVNGQLIIATIAASVSLIVMVVLGVENALAMAGIVGMLGLIPLIGATLAAAIVVLSTVLVSVKLAIVMAIYFIIYQQIENATIQPYIQGKRSPLSALMVFISALVGANIAGLLGAFLAIPFAGSLKVIFDDYIESNQPKSKA
ncbi:MAG: AI-2E family transporter [Patescibacteria group bacterium]